MFGVRALFHAGGVFRGQSIMRDETILDALPEPQPAAATDSAAPALRVDADPAVS